jgi:2-dehydro-3-deoxygalactonokinase
MGNAKPSRFVIDWGTSNFRAYRFAEDGRVAETHQAPCGILSVSERGFAAVLQQQIGHWLKRGDQLYFSGMITSRNGWIETPYVDAPAGLGDLARAAVHKTGEGDTQHFFLPGVCMRSPHADVMRGEEIQVFGSLAPDEHSAEVILPGTHSKWVRVEDGKLTHFTTHMTGEVFAVMRQHSILGRLMPEALQPMRPEAFLRGVARSQSDHADGLLHDLFTARSMVLLEQMPADDCADYLSGVLIGHEIRAGRAGANRSSIQRQEPIILVGDEALCRRYEMALIACDPSLRARVRLGPQQASVEGFARLNAFL